MNDKGLITSIKKFMIMKNLLVFFGIASLVLACLSSCEMNDELGQTSVSIKIVEQTPYAVTLECVIPDDGYPVTERGIKFGLDEKTTNYNKLLYIGVDNELQGISENLTGIAENATGTIRETFTFSEEAFQTYFFRLYEQGPTGIRYSNTVMVTMGSGKPDVSINPRDFIYDSKIARLSAVVVKEGNAPITRTGFCWNTTGDPTISDETLFLEVDGDNVDYFSDIPHVVQPFMSFWSDIESLKPNQTYYIGAFAENEFGISYSYFPFFTAIINRPILITLNPVINDGYVIFRGALVGVGGSDVFRIGVEASGNNSDFKCFELTIPAPISADDVSYTFQTEAISISEFNFQINNCYQIRAFACNQAGETGFGNSKSFFIPHLSTGK